jgi:hypothetical protein
MSSSKILNEAEHKMINALRARHIAAYSCPVGKKRCSQCQKVDDVDAFVPRGTWCKVCTKARMHEYYTKNKATRKMQADERATEPLLESTMVGNKRVKA